MPERSIFFEEWRDCLQAHYKTFVREEYLPQQDRKAHARESLEGVLHRVGFTDDDLTDLFSRALRTEDAPPDFMPTFQAHPDECQCAACMDTVLTQGHDANGQPLDVEPTPDPEPDAAGNIHPVLKLKSMFQFEDDYEDEPAPLPQEAEIDAGKGKRKSKKSGEAVDPKPRRQSLF